MSAPRVNGDELVREMGKALDPLVRRTLERAHEHLCAYDTHLSYAIKRGGMGHSILSENQSETRTTIRHIGRLLGYPPYVPEVPGRPEGEGVGG